MVFWCLRFPPKNERKQVNLRYHSSKVEFLRLFFGGNRRHQKPFRDYLTFSNKAIVICWLIPVLQLLLFVFIILCLRLVLKNASSISYQFFMKHPEHSKYFFSLSLCLSSFYIFSPEVKTLPKYFSMILALNLENSFFNSMAGLIEIICT